MTTQIDSQKLSETLTRLMGNPEIKNLINLMQAVSCASDVLEEAAGLVRRSLVKKPGEWAVQILPHGFVVVGKWYDLGGGIIGCKPGEAWIYTQQRTGKDFAGAAALGPCADCRLDIIPGGVELYAPMGAPRYACDEAKWEAWSKTDHAK